jgi:hypothetical protein
MPKPYPVVRPTRVPISLPDGSTDCAFALEDTPDGSKQRETLLIRTHVSPQLPNHPKALELAALLRVRELLDQQIQEMQSPLIWPIFQKAANSESVRCSTTGNCLHASYR